MHRIRRYIENAGSGQVLINALLLGYVVYLQINLARSGAVGMTVVLVLGVPAMVIGLLGPRLVLSWLVANASRVMKAMRWAWLGIAGYVVLVFLGLIPGSFYVYAPLLFAIFLFYGVQFWILSDDRVFTGRSLRVIRGSGA
ncbi:MAG: hypothetical protein Tsb0013_10120 [Phycisphaerales bacterium]